MRRRCLKRFVALCAVVFPLAADPIRTGAVEPDKPPALDDVREAAEEAQRAIHSISAEYSVEWNILAPAPWIKARNVGTEPFEIKFCMAGERRYLKKTSRRGDGRAAVRVAAFDGSDSLETSDGLVVLTTDEKRRHCESGDFYCSEFLHLAYSDRVKTSRSVFRYPAGLERPKDATTYVVSPEPAEIDGASCVVVEFPDWDKLWLDPRMGYAVRRRERFTPADDRVIRKVTYESSDFRQVGAGIWVPFKGRRTQYGVATDPDEYWDKPALEMLVSCKSVKVNNLTDDDFAIRVPPGIRIGIRKKGELVKDFFYKGDSTLQLTRFAELERPAVTAPRNWMRIAIISFNVVCAAILCFFVCRRLLRGARAPNET